MTASVPLREKPVWEHLIWGTRIEVSTAVFRLAYFASRLVPPAPKKVLNYGSAIGAQDAARDFHPMIELAMIQNSQC